MISFETLDQFSADGAHAEEYHTVVGHVYGFRRGCGGVLRFFSEYTYRVHTTVAA